MTCVLGIHDPEFGTVIAADGRVTFGDTIVSDQSRKVLVLGPWRLGVSGHSATIGVASAAADDLSVAPDAHSFTMA